MINIENFSACLREVDLRNGQIILYDTEMQFSTCFQSAGELFDAGWIADLQATWQFNLRTKAEMPTEQQDQPAAAENLSTRTIRPEANRVVPLKTCSAKDRA